MATPTSNMSGKHDKGDKDKGSGKVMGDEKGKSKVDKDKDMGKVHIQNCAECAGTIYKGEPMVKPFCMSGWICKGCISDMDPNMLKDESTIKVGMGKCKDKKADSD